MLPKSERRVPITTPKSAPWATMTRLEGTGSTTSTTNKPTPTNAPITPPRSNQGAGSVRSGTPSASTRRKRISKKARIEPATIQYRFIVIRVCLPQNSRACRLDRLLLEVGSMPLTFLFETHHERLC